MRKHSLYHFALAAAATLMLAAPSSASAQSLWSDPGTWPSGKVPKAGDAVEIARDMDVVLDVDAPALRSLTIQGKLSFSDKRDISLESEWIYVPGGELQIGTEAKPYTHQASITLTDNVPGEDINTMGDRGILLMRGTLNLHGDRDHTWTKLAKTAKAGSTSIKVLDAGEWRKGDEIVLASTDFDPRQAERRTITAVNGNALTLDRPLQYMHFGEITFGVDERGEVGMLTRNIRIQASRDSEQTYFGGHIMAMAGAKLYVDSVELSRMGQHLHLARYPLHFHVLGEGAGMYVRNAAIHDTFSRCVTVHGTNNLEIENNVTFNTVGHCFFMEDGIEHGNQFVHNLAMQTKCHPTLPCQPTNLGIPSERVANGQDSKDILIPSDNTAASFWITNPANDYIDNVAAGSDSNGFWMSLPEHPTGAFEGSEVSKATWPRRTPMGQFRGNVAHSNYDGFMFDRNVAPDGKFGVTGTVYIPRKDPNDPTSTPLINLYADLTAYKNRNGGLWMRGEETIFHNLHAADNAIGMTFASGLGGGSTFTSKTIDSLFVGETDNIGNPRTEAEKAYGRSLPKPQVPDYPIRGYEYYDNIHELANTTFVNFTDNDLRKTGALSYLLFTSFGMSVENSARGLKFVDAKPVYFPPRTERWASDYGTSAAFLTAAIHDLDGSTSGVPDTYIVIDNGIANDDEACEARPTWGAAVCKGDYGRLTLGGGFNFGGGPAEDPVTLSRNGRTFDYRGQTTIRSGVELTVDTAKESLPLRLSSMDEDSWVLLKLNGFTSADAGKQQPNMAALRAAREMSYFKDGEALWIKLFEAGPPPAGSTPFNIPPTVTVSKTGLGG
ncbi:transmembrane domain-containing protein [Altererythrobacter salegens]|uniref:Transmembrane domain-containing protein n=1 Tax=Croceibacterium salegens TaxID=1737568 RepID=A0A6I4SZV1_9SPHN|nr:G8 domain-containing protein [Croceibacterium salegens]MXO60750.1 transmembrane domain-containing protein [Croceibacterium salegens]